MSSSRLRSRIVPMLKKISEYCLVSFFVLLFWGIAILPFTFYYARHSESSSKNGTSCSAESYAGSACLASLRELQSCLPDRTTGGEVVYVSAVGPGAGSQEQGEEIAGLILSAVQSGLVEASQECVDAFLPFMCQYLFPLCNTSGDLLLPSQEECLAISTGVCQAEWEMAAQFLGDRLPTCADLPQSNKLCQDFTTDITGGNHSNETTTGPPVHNTTSCSKDFFLGSDGLCKPLCGSWEGNPHYLTVLVKVIVPLLTAVGVSMGIIVLFVSWIQRDRMLTFPSILIVYNAVAMMVLVILTVIPLFHHSTMCSSPNLLETITHSTAYCEAQGFLVTYIVTLVAFLTLFHMSIMFWGIAFPFNHKKFKSLGLMKYLHVATVLVCAGVSFIPPVVSLESGGFVIANSPPLQCLTRNRHNGLFSFDLTVSVVVAVGGSLLVLIFRKLFLHHKFSSMSNFGTAGRKLLALFFYIIIIYVTYTVTSIFLQKKYEAYIQAVLSYLACESTGPGNGECDRGEFESESTFMVALLVLGLVTSLYPLAAFLFAINLHQLKEFWSSKKFLKRESSPNQQA